MNWKKIYDLGVYIMELKKTKVFIIAPSGFGADGITSYIMTNYRKFDYSKLDITVGVTRIYGNEKTAEGWMLEIQNIGGHVVRLNRSGKNIIQYCCQFIDILRNEKFDVIHVHGSSSLIWLELKMAELCGVKRRIAHSHSTITNHPLIHKVLRNKLCKVATDCFACGNLAGKWMYGEHPYTVMPNGIDTKIFQFSKSERSSMRKSFGIDDETLVLGHVGNFNIEKNQKFLIDILKDLKGNIPNVRLYMIGSGETTEDVVEYAKNQGCWNKVLFLGQRTDVPALLQAMDIFLLPSLYEGFPIVAVEAQTSGLPVIVSDKITKEIALTDNVYFCSIDKGTASWLKIIKQCRECRNDREKYTLKICKAGYDISTTAQKLQKMYLS